MNTYILIFYFIAVSALGIGDFFTGHIRMKFTIPLIIFSVFYIPFNPLGSWYVLLGCGLIMFLILCVLGYFGFIGGGDIQLFTAIAFFGGIHGYYILVFSQLLAVLYQSLTKPTFKGIRMGLFIICASLIDYLFLF